MNPGFQKLRFAKHLFPARLEYVLREKIEKVRKNHKFFTKIKFSVFDHSLRFCSYKNYHKNLSFGYWQISLR